MTLIYLHYQESHGSFSAIAALLSYPPINRVLGGWMNGDFDCENYSSPKYLLSFSGYGIPNIYVMASTAPLRTMKPNAVPSPRTEY